MTKLNRARRLEWGGEHVSHLVDVHEAAVSVVLEWVVSSDRTRDAIRMANPRFGHQLDALQDSLKDKEAQRKIDEEMEAAIEREKARRELED